GWGRAAWFGVNVRRGRRRLGPRACLRGLVCLLDLLPDLGMDRAQFRRSRTIPDEYSAQLLDGALRLPRFHLLASAVREVTHAFGVRPGAVCLAFEQRRATARARPLYRLAGRGAYRQYVVAVEFDSRNAVNCATSGDARVAGGILEWHLGRKLI